MNTAVKAEKALTPLQQTMRSIDELRPTIADALPASVAPDRFISVVKTAINNKPELLSADRHSLFNACVMAAQDGLLPDNREGVLTVYNTNVAPKGQSPQYVNKVSWQPMIGGLRKKAAEHGFDLIDHAVHEHDSFDYSMGDDEHITHKAPPLGQPRGEIIGAYSIATNLSTGKKYYEVMDLETLEQIRKCAKSDSIWSAWPGEQARKSASRRLFKKLPFFMEEDIQRVLAHDDDNFDLNKALPAGKPVVAMPKSKAAEPIEAQAEPQVDPEDPFVKGLNGDKREPGED